jgi:hypothetical protein
MRKSEMVRAEMVCVPVATAKEWLSKNLAAQNEGDLKNRKKKVAVEDRYYNRMIRGQWDEQNGETIKFDVDGNLIDGQHRLSAQIRYGKGLWWLVAYNCSRRAFKTVDEGATRKHPDMLSMHGEENCNVLAATIGLVAKYKDGSIIKANKGSGISNADVYAMVQNEEGIVESSSIGIKNRGPKGFLAPSIVAFVHYMGSLNGSVDKANKFVDGLCNEIHCDGDQPIRALRKKLFENLVASKKASRVVVVAWCVKAWNAFYLGKTVTPAMLRYRIKPQKDKDGNVICGIEEFPKFANLL